MNNRISIIGAGAWGSALAHVFSKKYSDIIIYKRIINEISDDRFTYTNNIKDIEYTDNIFIAVPAQKVRNILNEFNKLKNHNIIICSKGIENHTQKFMSELIFEIIPNNNIFILSGPNFANEIINDLPSASLIAGDNIKEAKKIADDLSSDNFTIYPSDDVIGVQICGVMKNIIAIACGISIGLDLGNNIRSAIITSGIAEISQVIDIYGGKTATLISLAGIGDLTLTCNSSQSRNLQYGIDSVKNQYFDKRTTIEGIYSSIAINEIVKKHGLNLPICQFIYNYINNKADPFDIKYVIRNN